MQTVLHNVDRCVKNFISYYNPETARWSMIPWDMDSAFATDRLLGGQPLNDYCILACPQWNSPLFCNSEHPQARNELSCYSLLSRSRRAMLCTDLHRTYNQLREYIVIIITLSSRLELGLLGCKVAKRYVLSRNLGIAIHYL